MSINLFNVDCLDFMKNTEDNYFDLAVCDPPYGININAMHMEDRKTILKDLTKKWDKKIPEDEYFEHLKRVSKNQIVFGANYFKFNCYKYFFVWDKGEALYGRCFSECELAYVKYGGTKIFKCSPIDLNRIHPTQKPVKLYMFLLKNYAKPGFKILDTHMGSGSSAIACNELNFDFYGCEIDRDYFNDAKRRIDENSKQLLFNFV